jgi:hypothetical protein
MAKTITGLINAGAVLPCLLTDYGPVHRRPCAGCQQVAQ